MRRLLLAAVVLAACSPSVDPTNPYDPGTPPELQAKATVRGALGTTVLASPAGLPVALRTGGRIVSQVSTGPTGAFVFDRLVPGDYQVETAATGFMTQAIAVSLEAGDDLDLGEIALVPLYGDSAATLVGAVTLEGRADASGTLVEAVGKAFTALTDQSGGYRLTVIPGDYTLRFTHADFLPVTTVPFTVAAGETFAVEDNQLLSNPATVSGHVDGELQGGGTGPLVDAFVTLDGTSLTAVTNAAGDFTLTGIPSGSYLLRVVKSGYEGASLPVLNLVGGELRSLADPLALALSRGAIAGVAALADSSDASGVLVELVGTGRALVTGSDGGFTFSDLLVGSSYEVTARRDGYAPQSRTGISVVAGVTTTLPFPLTLARQGGTVSIVEAPYATSPAVTLQLAATGVTHYRASEDAGFAGASWLPFTIGVGQGFSLADADGEHVVYVQFATDGSGSNPSAVVSASVVLDRVAPVAPTLVVGDGSGWTRTVGGLVGLTLSAQDLPDVAGRVVSGLDRMELVNGADFSSGVQSYPYNTSSAWLLAAPTTDGPKTVSARFVDRTGNVSAPVTAAVTLDTLAPSAPSIALAGPDPARPGETNTPIVTASLSAADANGGPSSAWLFVRLANTSGFVGARYQPFEASLSWLLAAGDGDKTVWAQFMDPAGNESAPVSATVHLDTSGPSAPSLAVTEDDARPTNGQTHVAAVTLTLSASGTPVEAIVAENPALTGGTLFDLRSVPLPAAVPFTLGGLGLRTLWVRYYDAAGNPSELATATVTLDQTAPAATPPTIAPSPYAPTTAITVTPPNAGQDEIQIAGAGIAGTPSWVVAPAGVPIAATLTAGNEAKAIAVTYRDLAENVTAVAGLSVTLDGAAPSAFNFTVTGTLADGTTSTTYAASSSVTLDLSAQTDGTGSGIQEMMLSNVNTFAGAAWQPFSSSSAVPWILSPGDGVKTVYAKFKDAVGNTTAVAVTGTITLAATPPSGGTLFVEGGATATNKSTVSLAVSATGATQLRVAVDGFAGAWIAYPPSPAATATLTDPDQVNKVIQVTFRNAARVEGAGVSASIRYDHTAPTAGTLTLAGTLGNGATSAALTTTAPLVAQLVPPTADTAEMAIAQTTTATLCSSVFASPTWQPVARSATLVLTGADGAKRICALFRDGAGNSLAASAVGADITLDTSAPPNPSFVNVLSSTTNAYYAPAAGSPTVTAVTDPNGVTYQCIGGTSPAYGPKWVDCGASATLTSPFLLPTNQESTLGVRARDNAYNFSPGSFVRIVQDSVAPFPPFIADIRSSRDSVTITWDATADSDVVQYLVHYGNAPDDLTGTGAAQGASPVAAGAFFGIANPSFTLTGLTPGLPYYVAVEAVDAAGNRSGPSGVRLAVPNKVNPRVLSAFGGQPRSIGVLATASKTFAYLGQNQGIVQLDVSNDAGLPAVTGRAYLPDFVPDDRGSIAVFDCGKLVGAVTVQGHCAVPAGSTLEGDYRNDRDNYRAASPIVFFRTDGTSGAPTVGTIEGILPVRPHAVHTQTVGSDTMLYTVDRDGVRAFTFVSGKLNFLRQVASSDFPEWIQTIHGSGLFGDTVWVYTRPDPRNDERSSILYGFEVVDALWGDLYMSRYGELYDDADRSLGSSYWGTPTPLTLFHGGIYLAFAGYYTDQVTLASYTPGNPYPESILTFPSGTANEGDEPIATAGGFYNHLYVLSSGGMSDPTVWQATAVGTTLTPAGSAQDQGWDTSYALSMRKHDLSERLLTISRPVYPYWEMERWEVNGSTLTPQTTVPFRELPPDQFAESDRFLLVAQADKIHTVDVANPMAPIVVNTYTRGASRNFTKLKVHGRFLYAAAGFNGVEVYRINGSGTLTYRGVANPGNVTDLAVAGRYLFVTSSNGLSAYNVTSIASGVAPTLVQTLAVSPFLADAVDARIASAGGTSYTAVVYVAGREAGGPTMKTYTFNGAALTAYSTGTWTGDPGFTVEVRGNYAAVGTATATQLMYVGGGSPSAYRTHSTVSGPALLQAGYVVSGSSFVGLTGGAVDGTVRYSTCGPDYNGASIAHSTGLYAASCMKNGIMLYTPVALGGGRLHNSRDVSPDWWGTGRFATDGMSVWLSGPEVSGDRSRLYVASEVTTAEGTLSNPSWAASLESTVTNAAAMVWADGVLYVVTSLNPVTVGAYDPTSWTLLSRYTFGTSGSATAAATDGEYLYVARRNLGSGYLDALDIRNPWAMTLRASASVLNVEFRALALARDRLYAAADQGPNELNSTYVWDVSTVQASGTMSAAITVSMGGEGSITGIGVVGPWLFYSVHDPVYMAPLHGMGVKKLGTNRDGTGAVSVGSVQATLQPMQSPVVAGDVLYFAANAGLATWDLTPLWRDGAAPTPAGSVNLADPLITGAPVNFQIVGPFGFLTGGVYRVFDLR